jgi:hypothetical protein
LFKRHRNTYDGIIVPAHIASYYSAFCSEFIGSLQKPYIVDPMTYLFAGNPALLKRFVKDRKTGRTLRDRAGRKKKGDLKRSYSKLVEQHYGGLIEKAVVTEDRPVAPQDFANDADVDEFVRRVVEFQVNNLSQLPEKYRKYAKYAKKHSNASMDANPPMCVVPPYFSLDGSDGVAWLDVNVDLVTRTKARTELPVFPVILAASRSLDLNGALFISKYAATAPDGYILWVDGFSVNQDVAALQSVYRFVSRLAQAGKPVVLLYGDAFALVLHFAGLRGFACGICYSERKLSSDDVDVEGMIPPRYYVSVLKKKIQIATEARRIDFSQYPDLKCDCDICKRKPDPGTLDDTESREHFMLTRKAEVDALRSGSTANVVSQALESAFKKYQTDPLLSPVIHLRNWASVLAAK